MADKKEQPKQITAVDPADVSTVINTVVSLMESIDSSRELISSKLKYLKDTYGINSTDARAAATAIKKQNVEEIDEKARRIQELIDMCL
jgi:hypothetical protein